MSDVAPALASRSVVAVADLELLRVARTDVEVPRTAAPRLRDRMRNLAPFSWRSPAGLGRARGARRLRV